MKSFVKTNTLLVALAFGIASSLFAQVPDLTKDAQSVDRQRTNHLVAPGDFVWNSPVTGNWSDAAKWTNGQSTGVAPAAAGRADYALGFNQAGTYTVTHDLNAGFLLNKLVIDGGTLTLDGKSLAFAANGTVLPQLLRNGGSPVTIKTPVSLNANLTCGGTGTGGELTLSGVISGPGSLTMDGAGYRLTLLADNTYSGGTIINAGSVALGNTANTLFGTGAVTVNSPARLDLNGNGNLTNAFTLNGVTVTNGNSFSANLNGPITLAATSIFDLATTGNMTIGGKVSGSGGLTKNGTGQGPLILSGANTYSGPTAVNAGSLLVTSLNSVSGGTPSSNLGTPGNAAAGSIHLGSNTTPGVLIYSGPGETTDRVISLAGATGGATINQSGTGTGLPTTRGVSGLLKITGNIVAPGIAGQDNRKTLTLTQTMSSLTGTHVGQGEISGMIGDSVLGTAGQLATSLTKDGPGTWILSGANTYSGTTSVKAGTLAITRAKSLGSGALDIAAGAKVQLDFIGTQQIAALTFNGGAAQANGTYGSTLSPATHKDDVHFAGPGTLTVGATASPTTEMAGAIPPPTTTTLARTGGNSPSKAGEAVTFTATVTGKAPTGSVTFYDGTTALGNAPLNGTKAAFTTSKLAAGWRHISARYAGDAANQPSTSTQVCYQTVNPPAGNGKLKVFILAGQSNMVGYGSVENGRDPNNLTGAAIPGGLGSLRRMLNANPTKYAYLADQDHPIDGGSPGWITRPDVWITYYGGTSWELSPNQSRRNGNLDANYGADAANGLIGPEYGFGLVVGSQLADQVLLIKYAHGGRSLAGDFRPPSSGGTVGPCYTDLIGAVHKVLNHIAAEFPAYAGGGYELVGLGWHQGWNDRCSAPMVAEYETNMVNLIKDLRAEFHAPNMRVAIANTGMACAPTGNGSLIEAQGNVADPTRHPELADTVITVDTRPFDYGELMGVNGQGFHWYFNGESYFNIGESMGQAMMGLLQPTPARPASGNSTKTKVP